MKEKEGSRRRGWEDRKSERDRLNRNIFTPLCVPMTYSWSSPSGLFGHESGSPKGIEFKGLIFN